jgi:hypothetical protein
MVELAEHLLLAGIVPQLAGAAVLLGIMIRLMVGPAA